VRKLDVADRAAAAGLFRGRLDGWAVMAVATCGSSGRPSRRSPAAPAPT